MKKLLYSILSLFIATTAFSQTHLAYFNPFGVPHADAMYMTNDDQGDIWFSTVNLTEDSFYIVNLSGTKRYVFSTLGSLSPYPAAFVVDSRGDILWSDSERGLTLIHPSGQLEPLEIPGESYTPTEGFYYSSFQNISDHIGNDYFLSAITRWDMNTQTQYYDTVFLTKFDGNNFTKYNLTDSGISFIHTKEYYKQMVADYDGNVYIQFDSISIVKFDGSSFTQIPRSFTERGTLFADRNDNIYFNDQGSHIYKIYPGYQMIYNHGAGNILCSNLALDNNNELWLLNNNAMKYENGQFNEKVGFYDLYDPNVSCFFCSQSLFDRDGNMLSVDYGCEVRAYSFKGFNTMSGTVFIDNDENGVKDSNESGLEGVVIIQSPDYFVASTDSNGAYNLVYFDSAVTHTVSYTAPMYYSLTTPASYTISHDTALQCCYNFGVAPAISVQDLKVDVTTSFAVPGFQTAHWINIENVGTTIAGDSVVYVFDPLYSYLGSSLPAEVVSGNTLKWSNTALQPFQNRTLTVSLYLDSTIAIGTLLSSTGTIHSVVTDATPSNNSSLLTETVVGPFDPNMKVADKSTGMEAGDTIQYTIHFQNTGNFTATDVTLRDTLDTGLYWSSFDIISSSHAMTYDFRNNGILTFYFDNIMLPDSNANEALSHGFVKYSIRTKNTLSYGTPLYNSASIYFDFNLPIKTNTATSWIGQPVGIEEYDVVSNSFGVYPNPANDIITLILKDNESGYKLYMTDVMGKLVLFDKAAASNATFSLKDIDTGIYFITAVSNNNGSEYKAKLIVSR